MFQPSPSPMRRSFCNSWVTFASFILLGATALAMPCRARAAEPRIDYIEPFLTNRVLIHFDTEANRTYTLQYTSSLSATSRWSNMFTGFAFPFPNHYIIVDTNSMPQRFYRLSVKP